MRLEDLSEAEFTDELGESLGLDEAGWRRFLAPENQRRTGEALELMQQKVVMQLTAHEGAEDGEEWERRARNFRSLVEFRLRQVRRRIHESEGSLTAREKAWKAFANELAEALEESDLDGELDVIQLPLGDITARQWLARRREKRGIAAA